MAQGDFVPLEGYQRLGDAEMAQQAREFARQVQGRRSVRDFASDPVPQEVIEHCLRAAITAPSGANRQPWHFCVASQPGLKRQIRLAAESAEMRFYRQTAPEAWLEAVRDCGAKAFLKPQVETRANGTSLPLRGSILIYLVRGVSKTVSGCTGG